MDQNKTPVQEPQEMSGVVEKIEYTSGGFGNQFTTIDGVRYVTFWDSRSVNWKTGDTVDFTAVYQPIWPGQATMLHAKNINKSEVKPRIAKPCM